MRKIMLFILILGSVLLSACNSKNEVVITSTAEPTVEMVSIGE